MLGLPFAGFGSLAGRAAGGLGMPGQGAQSPLAAMLQRIFASQGGMAGAGGAAMGDPNIAFNAPPMMKPGAMFPGADPNANIPIVPQFPQGSFMDAILKQRTGGMGGGWNPRLPQWPGQVMF